MKFDELIDSQLENLDETFNEMFSDLIEEAKGKKDESCGRDKMYEEDDEEEDDEEEGDKDDDDDDDDETIEESMSDSELEQMYSLLENELEDDEVIITEAGKKFIDRVDDYHKRDKSVNPYGMFSKNEQKHIEAVIKMTSKGSSDDLEMFMKLTGISDPAIAKERYMSAVDAIETTDIPAKQTSKKLSAVQQKHVDILKSIRAKGRPATVELFKKLAKISGYKVAAQRFSEAKRNLEKYG